MTDKELKTIRKKMAEHKKETTSSPEAAQEALIKAGILTKKGNLKKMYRP